MANWDTLKAAIADVIKTNGNQEITGDILQNVLTSMVSNMGVNATLAGVATTQTNPGTPDGPVYYFAAPGTYSNFSGLVVPDNNIGILIWSDGVWSLQRIYMPDVLYIAQELGDSENAVISQKTVTNSVEELSNSILYKEQSVIFIDGLHKYNAVTGELESSLGGRATEKIAISTLFKAKTYVGGAAILGIYYWKDNGNTYLGCDYQGTNAEVHECIITWNKSRFPDADTIALTCLNTRVDDFRFSIADTSFYSTDEMKKTAFDLEEFKTEVSQDYAKKTDIPNDEIDNNSFAIYQGIKTSGKKLSGTIDIIEATYENSALVKNGNIQSGFSSLHVFEVRADEGTGYAGNQTRFVEADFRYNSTPGVYVSLCVYDEDDDSLIYSTILHGKNIIGFQVGTYVRIMTLKTVEFIMASYTIRDINCDGKVKYNDLSNFKAESNIEPVWIDGLYYRNSATGALTTSGGCKSSELIEKPDNLYFYTKLNGAAQTALQLWDSEQNYIGFIGIGTNGVETTHVIVSSQLTGDDFYNYNKAKYISVCCLNNRLEYLILNDTDEVVNYKLPAYPEDIPEVPVVRESRRKGKTIYFCGTSIPAGGYPQIVCELLGATCVNKSVGASVLRKALRDGGGFTQFEATTSDTNYVLAFTATKDEKEALFSTSNYNYASYEELLLPYLNGTNDMPDLFVIDFAADDKTRSGKTDPYFAQINTNENALLPEDYPLATDSLTSSRGVQFNRNSYTGAANFIIDLIYQYNPQAKIILMGFQNEQLRPRQVEAQKVVADYWQIPYFPLSELLQWSEKILYGSKDKFNTKYSGSYSTSSDVSAMKYWCPDGIHPHSNNNLNEFGYKESNYEIAIKLSKFINDL